jgi:predicted DNA-binding protein (UPF0251 family)
LSIPEYFEASVANFDEKISYALRLVDEEDMFKSQAAKLVGVDVKSING